MNKNSRTAEELFDENSSPDSWELHSLNKSERKKLNEMRVESAKKKSMIVRKVGDQSAGRFSHYNSEQKSLICGQNFSFEPKFLVKKENHGLVKRENNDLVKREIKGSVNQLVDNKPVNVFIGEIIRSSNISDEDVIELEIIRKPNTNPFAKVLRRPKIVNKTK
jgi:hypothetical protein